MKPKTYVNPFHIHWQWAFMIEAIALFFYLGMVAIAITRCERQSWTRLVPGLMRGVIGRWSRSLAGGVASGSCALFVLTHMLDNWIKRRRWALFGVLFPAEVRARRT